MIREKTTDGVVELVVEALPHNIFSSSDIAALALAFHDHARDANARAIVLRAEGPGFCGGAELPALGDEIDPEYVPGSTRSFLGLMLAIADAPIPVVIAVHGYCIGLGALIAGVCDVVVSAPNVPFALADANEYVPSEVIQAMGLFPEKCLSGPQFGHQPVMSDDLSRFGSVKLARAQNLTDVACGIAQTFTPGQRETVRDRKSAVNGDLRRRIGIAFEELDGGA